jgi:RNA polymerase sigma factor (sigma-70 family)
MASTVPQTISDNLRAPLLRQDVANLTDGDLVERFLAERDESAFAALIHRHGPMVLGVCRRILRNDADAEDAFQSTFLVLVRKAGSIRPRSMVGNWLYGVAHNTALKARSMNTKRLEKEREAAARPQSEWAGPTWLRLQPLLDQELNALPDKYRAAIVLCDLEGKPLKDVARQLGCPIGTIGTRVARGRVLLGRRLSRHGLVLSTSALALLLSQNVATASVPAALVTSTTKAAAAYMTGSATISGVIPTTVANLTLAVLKSMLVDRIKIALAVFLMCSLIAAGGVSLAQQAQSSERRARANSTRTVTELQGTWVIVSMEHAGKPVPQSTLKEFGDWVFDSDKFRVTTSKKSGGTFRTEPTTDPKEIDLITAFIGTEIDDGPRTRHGIYKLDGDTMTICLAGPISNPSDRPRQFASLGGPHWTSLFVFHRLIVQKQQCGS